jgi:LAS superfamily LD-carboxypeptidase LdcB/putative cell wall-binding protein
MPSRAARALLALFMTLSALVVAAPPAAAAGLTVERLSGADRFGTAAAISRAQFPAGAPVVYVATGASYPDALAAGPAAARAGGPILLVTATEIPRATDAELRRLLPSRIVIIGLRGAVSDAVAQRLDAYDTGGGVTRVGGGDRYATAAAISAAHFPQAVPVAYVATGANFPDALAGGVAASVAGAPLLLVGRDVIHDATRAELGRLAPGRIVIIGGTGAVSDSVARALRTYTRDGSVTRIAGADRYATAVAVSRAAFPSGASAAFVATGRSFPDAMVAVPAAARSGAPLLLVPGTSAPAAVEAEVRRLAPNRLVLLGGTAALTERVTLELRVAVSDLPPVPACAYRDVPTRFAEYEDWRRTLVDTIYMVPADYHPQDLVDVSRAGFAAGRTTRASVIADLKAMADAARAAGRPIQIASAFRSYSQQQATFQHWVNVNGYEEALRTSARPAHSEHQLGTTFDFTSLGGAPPWEYPDWARTGAGAWMAENAWRFGFVMSYPRSSFDRVCYDYEPWHYRYLGREVAKAVHASGLTLREWLWLNGSGA